MKTVWCYVDESGQDTKGDLFVVVTVIISDKNVIDSYLESIEKNSGVQSKWRKTQHNRRMKYFEAILDRSNLKDTVYIAKFPHSGKAFVDLTILAVAKALKRFEISAKVKIIIIVDGLRKNERHRFAAGLRKLGISPNKVRGAREESTSLLRYADMVLGLSRDAFEGKKYAKAIENRLIKKKILRIV
ncbi:DUF3800 domain-containing protein [Candidatus Berkelbacteria bacterium]|nr:DUF3800 domain-containing protein [Candidatus Berkelbacteria bacterium]